LSKHGQILLQEFRGRWRLREQVPRVSKQLQTSPNGFLRLSDLTACLSGTSTSTLVTIGVCFRAEVPARSCGYPFITPYQARSNAYDPDHRDQAWHSQQDAIDEAEFDRTAVTIPTRLPAHGCRLPQMASHKLAVKETPSNANLMDVNREAIRLKPMPRG
jgi:hypothetical protein